MIASHLARDDWQVLAVPDHAEVVALVRRHHYSRSAPNTSTYRHGLYRTDATPFRGDLLGVTLWIPPTRAAAESVAGEDWRGVLTLSRLVVLPEVPTNGASFLLGRSMRAIDRAVWPVLVTYADTRHGHTGAIYKATNWQEWGPVPAADTWTGPDGEQRGRKRGGHTLTVRQMSDLGFARNPAMPKIKFVHRVGRRRPLDTGPITSKMTA